jgi:nucleoside-diphosphate-sugar epimerase
MIRTEAVVLFGAGGFIGRNLTEAWVGQMKVYGVTASGVPVPGTIQTFGFHNLKDMPVLPKETVIVNAAAYRYDFETFSTQQNAILFHNAGIVSGVYQFAASRGIQEVRLASSCAVYPATWELLDDERTLDLNGWPHANEAGYAWSKRWAEIVADIHHRQLGINTITFRLTNPYGRYDTLDVRAAHVAAAFAIRSLQPGSVFEIRGDPDAQRDFVFAEDVAAVFGATLDVRGRHETCNLAQGKTNTIRQLAEAALAASGLQKTIVETGSSMTGVRVRHATGSKLRRLFNVRPFQDLREGMRQTVEWYRHAAAG